MKLHLPKGLLVAVLAACGVSQTLWAGDWSSVYTNTYNINNGDAIDVLSTADNADTVGVFIRAGEDSVTANIKTLNMVSGVKLVLSAGYPTDSYDLASLTIGSLNVADGGSTALDVGTGSAADMQKVVIESISGTVTTLNVGAKGNLTIGKAGDTTSSYTLQSVDVVGGGTLTLAGGVTTMGNGDESVKAAGEIVVNSGAVLKFAAKDNTHWSNKTNITLLGGEWDTNGTRQNFAAGSVIKLVSGKVTDTNGTFGDAYGVIDITSASIESSGTSSIAGGVRLRNNNVDVDVQDGTLTVDRIVNHKGMTGGIVKKGSGTLVLTSLAKGNWYGEVQEYFAGNITLEAGAIEYAINKTSETSTSDGTYEGTISGKGNVVKSGTGTVTLTSINNLDGEISVSNGILNITSLAANKTQTISITGENSALNIGGVSVDVTNWTPSSSSGKYFVYELQGEGDTQQRVAVESTGNGFYADSSTYLLFDGYEWTGNVAGYTTENKAGDTYLTANGDVSSIWHVHASDFTVDGLETNAAAMATGYHVESGKTLIIEKDQNTSMKAAKILSETTGAGNIKLTTDVTMTGAALATGKLTVDGAMLTVDVGNKNENSYLTSFDSIDLNDATVRYHGSATTWKNVTVGAEGATIKIKDMDSNNSTDKVLTLAETTNLKGALTIESSWQDGDQTWKYGVNIEELTGTGDLIIKGTTHSWSNGEQNHVTAKLLETYKGTISVEQSPNNNSVTKFIAKADGAINLKGINVSGGATVDLSGVVGTKNLGTVTVGANTTLNLLGTVGNMAAIGDGVISLADGTSFTGTASIDNRMTLAGTITNSGNLTLTGALNAASLDVFDGTQAYVGDVEGNGYLSAAYTIVQASGNNSQLTANGLTLTIAGTSYDLSKVGNDLKYVASGNGGTYYVNTTQDYAVGSKIASDATTGITMNGGTLNLKTALADEVAISTAKAGSVINVAGGVTLSQGSVVAGNTKSTITGGSTAVYDMGAAVTLNVNLSSEWMGTVVISNANYDTTGIRLNSLGNANSKVKLMGINGWFDVFDVLNGAGYDFAPDIELENYVADGVTKSALIVSDNSNGTYNFQGSISGTGDIQLASKGNNTTSGMMFSGDTSQWTGGLLLTNAYSGDSITSPWTVSFTSGGDIFSAEGNKGIVMNRASNADGNENILSLNIGNADKASTMNGAISMGEKADANAQLKLTVTGDTTFKKGVEVTSLTVDAGKTATLEGTTTTGSLTTNGTVKVTGSGSLTYGGNTTVTAPAAQTFAMETPGATITNNAITGGNVTFSGTESVTESRIISDSSIVNNATGKATINVGAENLSLYAANGDIELTTLESGASIGIVTVAAGKNISSVGNLTVEDSLTLNGSGALSVTGDLDLSNASSLTLNGAEASNWANVSGMFTMSKGTLTLGGDILKTLATLESGSQLEVLSVGSFTLGGQAITSDLTYESGYTLDQVFVGASSDYYLGYTANADGTGGIVYIGVIPEPTTATLSLMALAALAARRRRK